MHPGFFEIEGPFSLAQIADHTGAQLQNGDDGSRLFSGLRPLQVASSMDIAFFENRRYVDQLKNTAAGACILASPDAALAPAPVAKLIAERPYEAFASAMRLFYADALRSKVGADRLSANGQSVHPSAQIEEGAVIGSALDDGVNNTCHLGGDGDKRFASEISVVPVLGDIAFKLVSKAVLALPAGDLCGHP